VAASRNPAFGLQDLVLFACGFWMRLDIGAASKWRPLRQRLLNDVVRFAMQ
jgi:hypothetical protein